MHYTYMLRCGDQSLYTGYTNRLEYRVKMHQEGKGAKYTRGRGPVKLVYVEGFESKSDALMREYEIKQLPKHVKEKLVEEYNRKKIK
ncbi:GIY-YIG nuclease family protein [Salirhabdus sp. Marseille-P4669]|uniref:GIY-YIG nuclease family protein n=1 Tax=Salirhabdus sp. Marseille-P4669 TaxID=2042310 RepID=UPI000C7CAD01|nr:GIY-YIG nuclease family protein [Salirhabdus sp. Marseille-P4669]